MALRRYRLVFLGYFSCLESLVRARLTGAGVTGLSRRYEERVEGGRRTAEEEEEEKGGKVRLRQPSDTLVGR